MAVRVRPVAVCVGVTVPPGRTLPLESRTVPAIEALDTPCANTIDPVSSKTKKHPSRCLLVRLISNMGTTSSADSTYLAAEFGLLFLVALVGEGTVVGARRLEPLNSKSPYPVAAGASN